MSRRDFAGLVFVPEVGVTPLDESIATVDLADGTTQVFRLTEDQFASIARGGTEYGPDKMLA